MNTTKKLLKPILVVALSTIVLLTIPGVATQLTAEVNWSLTDFGIAGILLFSTGLSYVLIMRSASSFLYKIAITLALGVTLFMVWANLAVGLIGSGPTLENLMYGGVVAITIIGLVLSNFNTGALKNTMFITALALALVAVTALLRDEGQRTVEILGVNGFFFLLYVISGLLFHYEEYKSQKSRI